MFLIEELKELQANIPNMDLINPSISEKGIDWHIDHSYRVIIEVSKILIKSNPDNYKRDFNLSRSVVFMTNIFPRGKARAPKSVVALDEITNEILIDFSEKATAITSDVLNLPAYSHYKHHVFGNLDLEMTKQFIKIHTFHHIKIIREILKNKKK